MRLAALFSGGASKLAINATVLVVHQHETALQRDAMRSREPSRNAAAIAVDVRRWRRLTPPRRARCW